jgi:hypothetical protein
MLFASTVVSAEISVLRCQFDGSFSVFITTYSDGTPARIGTGPGIGDRAHAIHDRRTGARVFVEVNTDDIPTTLTTVQPDLKAIHSRHLIGPYGEVAVPSQQRGKCERITL